MIERFSKQLRRVGGNGRFFLQSRWMAHAHEESAQQQRRPVHGAARERGQRTRTFRVQPAEQQKALLLVARNILSLIALLLSLI